MRGGTVEQARRARAVGLHAGAERELLRAPPGARDRSVRRRSPADRRSIRASAQFLRERLPAPAPTRRRWSCCPIRSIRSAIPSKTGAQMVESLRLDIATARADLRADRRHPPLRAVCSAARRCTSSRAAAARSCTPRASPKGGLAADRVPGPALRNRGRCCATFPGSSPAGARASYPISACCCCSHRGPVRRAPVARAGLSVAVAIVTTILLGAASRAHRRRQSPEAAPKIGAAARVRCRRRHRADPDRGVAAGARRSVLTSRCRRCSYRCWRWPSPSSPATFVFGALARRCSRCSATRTSRR